MTTDHSPFPFDMALKRVHTHEWWNRTTRCRQSYVWHNEQRVQW